MKFVREDYHEMRAKRIKVVVTLFVVTTCMVLLLMVLLNKKVSTASPEQESTAQTLPETTERVKGHRVSSEVKDLPSLFATLRQSVVLITTYDASNKKIAIGTGFFISETGILVSNRHVFGGANRAEVEGTAGKFSISRILAESSDYDMVRVQVDIRQLKVKPVVLGSAVPQVGEKVLVIGNPMGLEASISDGIVSAMRNIEPFGNVIQITSPISPGSSGSPVLNMKGEVIGVATFQVNGGQNLNFAIPIARLQQLNKVDSVNFATINFGNAELVKAQDNPFDQGMILYSRQEYEAAIPYFEEAVKRDTNNASAYLHLGICYRETKKTNAVAAFKSALDINQNYAEAYCHLGITYVQLNQAPEAIEALREARRLKPDYDEAYMYLGIAYNLNKDYSSAVNILEKAIDIRPDIKAYYYLGYSYSQMGQHEKAIEALNHCLEIDENLIDAYVALGSSYAAIQYWQKGIKVLNKAVILAPENTMIHFILGVLHVGNDDLDSALHELDVLEKLRAEYDLISKLRTAINRVKYSR